MTDSVKIVESGMTFVVPQDELFHIEPYVQENIGVKTVEFVWFHQNTMKFIEAMFVEAKSSAPRPQSSEDLNKYIKDISEKWLNSIHITASKALGDIADNPLKIQNWKGVDINLCLVLGNGFKMEWLPPLQNAFSADSQLKKWQKVWNPSNPAWIKILNEETARKIGILQAM